MDYIVCRYESLDDNVLLLEDFDTDPTDDHPADDDAEN